MEPREYQKVILETAKDHNTLIVIPTGLGKTLIAFLLMKHYLEKFPKGKILILAPTRPLVEQHFKYFEENLPELYAELQMFTGKVDAKEREKLWQMANVIFSTPQCIANDLKKRKIDLSEVSLLVEDEAHRCLKNYDYTYVAKKFLETPHTVSSPRIIGMTASPGSDNETIRNICENLNIQKIEARHRESEDVKAYVEKLSHETLKVDLTKEIIEISDLIKHIYASKIMELKNRKLLFGPGNKKTLLDLQMRLAGRLKGGDKHFNVLRGMSVCAQAIKVGHALELIETQGISQTHKYFQKIIDDSNKGKSKAAKQIANNPDFMTAFTKMTQQLGGISHPKMEKLKEVVENEIKANPKARFIIFAQYRDTVVAINKLINEIPGIKSRVFVGQMKKDDTGLSQKEQQHVLNEFRFREVNALTATSIGEEGLDLPEVSAVIFYEPIPSAIRSIQRRGRTARLKPGKLIVLLTKKTKDEINYFVSARKEKKMYKILGEIKQKLDNPEKTRQNTLF
ncbi:DEAD/DEAH box helicase [Nanoarchaeota archaeon]